MQQWSKWVDDTCVNGWGRLLRPAWELSTFLEREREMFYLTTHSTHFIYGYMASDIWLRTILLVRNETCCRHIGYSYRLTARFFLYAPSHRQDNTYHSLCYTSRGALAGMRNSSMGPPHEGSIWRPIAPWANFLGHYELRDIQDLPCSHSQGHSKQVDRVDNIQGPPRVQGTPNQNDTFGLGSLTVPCP